MRKSKALLIIIALVLLAYFAWRIFGGGGRTAAESPDLGANRIWVDSQPEKYTDKVNVFLMVDDLRMGVFQEASAYVGRFELFEYRRRESEVDLKFPQDGRAVQLRYAVTSCSDLHPFDLCLDLDANPWSANGPTRYYGVREQDGESDVLRALRRRANAVVEAALR